MKISIKKALDNWIKGAGPFSFHPMDMNRFYDLVHECIKEDYILTQEDIAEAIIEHLELIDTKVCEKSEEFEVRVGAIFGFAKFLKEKKDADIKSML